MKKVCKIFQYITLIISIILIMLILVPNIFGIKPYVVLSGSMEPVIKTGSVVYVNTKVKYENIKVGDIISYKARNSNEITHRVIRINDDNSLATKGDANKDEDMNSITTSMYVGKDVLSIPYIGYIMVFLKTKLGLGILLGIVFINFAIIIFGEEEYKIPDIIYIEDD